MSRPKLHDKRMIKREPKPTDPKRDPYIPLYHVQMYTPCGCPYCDQDAHWLNIALVPKDIAEEYFK